VVVVHVPLSPPETGYNPDVEVGGASEFRVFVTCCSMKDKSDAMPDKESRGDDARASLAKHVTDTQANKARRCIGSPIRVEIHCKTPLLLAHYRVMRL
jgi:hypothetical protein